MLDDDQLTRYARQVILPEFGEENQERLLTATVLVIGAGGLGAPLIQYLAAAGIGRLRIVDDDEVELTNLNRQVVHSTARIATPKAQSAAAAVAQLNPGCVVEPVVARFSADTAADLLSGVEVIADCSDTPDTRYLVNAAAHEMGLPVVFGGAVRMEGQITTFASGRDPESPCFRCIFPETAGHDLAPRCSEAGIFGPVTGVIGTLMAMEVLKQCLLPATPLGEGLVGRLMLYDAREQSFMPIRVRPRSDCPVCSGR
ncbi:ThiF family adenylyltransferase [Alphaproteobacteria bacterium LSUCC0684]